MGRISFVQNQEHPYVQQKPFEFMMKNRLPDWIYMKWAVAGWEKIRTSILNEHHPLHHCQNVFVSYGACVTSTGNQSQSLLYMALTARAVDFAINKMKEGNL